MPPFEPEFVKPLEHDDSLCQVLWRMSGSGPTSPWTKPPDGVRVERALTGGLSGGGVFELTVRWGNQETARVLKTGGAEDLVDEWCAYDEHLRDRGDLCAPIEAATKGIFKLAEARKAGKTTVWGGGQTEGVVYNHAGHYAGVAPDAVPTLETVVRNACAGDRDQLDLALQAIDNLLGQRARNLFYSNWQARTTASSWGELNRLLGPDLLVEEVEEDTASRHGTPGPEWWGYGRVMAVGTQLTVPQAQPILLTGLSPVTKGAALLGELGGGMAAVELGVDTRRRQELRNADDFLIHATVRSTRAQRQAKLIEDHCGDAVQLDGGEVRAGDIAIPAPWAGLADLLQRKRTGRVLSLAHGDLNARNVLLAKGRPYLIDYAHTRPGQPVLGDFCWLELDLLRRAIGDRLSFAEVVRLQRVLALAGQVLDGLADNLAESIGRAWSKRLSVWTPALVGPFRILWAVRVQSRLAYPREAGPSWSEEYLTMLAIWANRTLKWHDHPAGGVAASVAVAGASLEALREEQALVPWPSRDLLEAAATMLPLMKSGGPRALVPMKSLVGSVDRCGLFDREVESLIDDTRAELVRTNFRDEARALGLELLAKQPRHVRLRAVALDGALTEGEVLELLRTTRRALLSGEAGSGKSATAVALRHRLATSITRNAGAADSADWAPRLPLAVSAVELAARTSAEEPLAALGDAAFPGDTWGAYRRELFTLGAVTLIVDELDRLPEEGRRAVVAWSVGLAQRYPRVRLLICARTPVPELPQPTWRNLALKELDTDQMLDYLVTAAGDRQSVIRLGRLLAEQPTRELPAESRLPLFLSLLVHAWSGGGATRAGEVVRDFAVQATAPLARATVPPPLHARPAERTHREPDPAHTVAEGPSRPDGNTLAEPVLARLAATLTRAASDGIEPGKAHDLVTPLLPPDRPHLLDELMACGVLRVHNGLLAFARPVLRDHYAGRWLALRWASDSEFDDLDVSDRVWLEPFKLLFGTLPPGHPLLESVIGRVLERDLLAAAALLRSAAIPPPVANDRFLRVTRDVLSDPAADPAVVRHAAAALAGRRSTSAQRLLAEVAGDGRAAPAVRAACLDVLAVLVASATSAVTRAHRAAVLRRAVVAMLQEPAPEALLVPALEAVGRLRVRGLELHLSELVSGGSWKAADAADRALRALDVQPTTAFQAAYTDACARRLYAMDAELRAATSHAEHSALRAERERLLLRLADPGHLDVLLRYRFRFGTDGHVTRLLSRVAGTAPPVRPSPIWDILAGPPRPDAWIASFEGEDEPAATVAAHRLLAYRPHGALHILRRARPDDDDLRLLTTAAAVPEVIHLDEPTGTECLEQMERLTREVLATSDAERLEVLAALVCGIFAVDRLRGVRLAHAITRHLAEGDDQRRHHWPWIEAFARCKGTASEFEQLLGGDEDDVDSAVTGLSGHGFLLDASPGPGYRLGGAARRRLLMALESRLNRGDPAYVARAFSACATAGLPSALPHALRAVAAPGRLPEVVLRLGTQRYGLIEQCPLADVMAAAGYLARLAGPTPDAEQVRELLTAADVASMHPSVALGRLVGLAYLGDWQTALEAASPQDFRSAWIARNAVVEWAPSEAIHLALAWLDRSGVRWAELKRDIAQAADDRRAQ